MNSLAVIGIELCPAPNVQKGIPMRTSPESRKTNVQMGCKLHLDMLLYGRNPFGPFFGGHHVQHRSLCPRLDR